MPSMQILRRDRGLMSRIMTYCGSGERAGEVSAEKASGRLSVALSRLAGVFRVCALFL